MTREMGKPIAAAVAKRKCAAVCRYYAVNAEYFMADEVVETNASRSYDVHELERALERLDNALVHDEALGRDARGAGT